MILSWFPNGIVWGSLKVFRLSSGAIITSSLLIKFENMFYSDACLDLLTAGYPKGVSLDYSFREVIIVLLVIKNIYYSTKCIILLTSISWCLLPIPCGNYRFEITLRGYALDKRTFYWCSVALNNHLDTRYLALRTQNDFYCSARSMHYPKCKQYVMRGHLFSRLGWDTLRKWKWV